MLAIRIIETIITHVLPLTLYRYFIAREPVSPSKARKMVAVYAVFLILFYTVMVGIVHYPAIFLWSYVTYLIITRGYKEPEPQPVYKSHAESADSREQVGKPVRPMYKEKGEKIRIYGIYDPKTNDCKLNPDCVREENIDQLQCHEISH